MCFCSKSYLYVGFKLSHGMKTDLSQTSPGLSCGDSSKSHSHEMVDCSRPVFSSGGSSSSLRMNVYRFSGNEVRLALHLECTAAWTLTVAFGYIELDAGIV